MAFTLLTVVTKVYYICLGTRLISHTTSEQICDTINYALTANKRGDAKQIIVKSELKYDV